MVDKEIKHTDIESIPDVLYTSGGELRADKTEEL